MAISNSYVKMCRILMFYDVRMTTPGHSRRRSVVEDAAEARPAVGGPGCGRELRLKLEKE